MGEQRTSGLGGDLDLLSFSIWSTGTEICQKKYGGQKLKKTRDLHHSLLCNTDTGYCFTQYNIFCTKLDSKCVKLNSTCGKYAVNSYGKAYSMIMKLGSSVGLFVTSSVSCR